MLAVIETMSLKFPASVSICGENILLIRCIFSTNTVRDADVNYAAELL